MLNNDSTRKNESAMNTWKYISLTRVVLIAAGTVLFAYSYLNLNSHLSDLHDELSNIENQLSHMNNRIQILEYLNTTAYLPLPQIFNMVKNSVVLITTNAAQGSGFVYDYAGHIVTNYHVIEGATNIQVTFVDGNVTDAIMVGEDPYSDIAVIKVNPATTTLYSVVLGNSSNLIVGEPIVAVGNPFGLSDTMTAGIISQLGRDLSAPGGYLIVDVIQVDAAINPGNSGGPLVDMNGEVAGVNTAIISGSGTFAGVGFAIPSDTIKREVPSLIQTGTYRHPWIGISGLDVTLDIAREMGLEKVQGFLIVDVSQGSPANDAGLRGGDETILIDGQEVKIGGDVIVGVDDLGVRNLNDLVVYVERNRRPGDTTSLKIIREGAEMARSLVLGERPPP